MGAGYAAIAQGALGIGGAFIKGRAGRREQEKAWRYARKETLSKGQRRARSKLISRLLGELDSPTKLPSSLFAPSRDIVSRTAASQRRRARGDIGLPAGLLSSRLGDIDRGVIAGESNIIGQAEQRAAFQRQQTIAQILQLIGQGTSRYGAIGERIGGMPTWPGRDWAGAMEAISGAVGSYAGRGTAADTTTKTGGDGYGTIEV